MSSYEKRKHIRVKRNFRVELSRPGDGQPLEGVSQNISQGGAFIKTRHWRSLQVHDLAFIQFLLPPRIPSEKNGTRLRGTGTIIRIDEQREGVAVHFDQLFRHFKPV